MAPWGSPEVIEKLPASLFGSAGTVGPVPPLSLSYQRLRSPVCSYHQSFRADEYHGFGRFYCTPPGRNSTCTSSARGPTGLGLAPGAFGGGLAPRGIGPGAAECAYVGGRVDEGPL